MLSDENISQKVINSQPHDIPENLGDDKVKDSEVPSNVEVMKILHRCLLWYKGQPESNAFSALMLKESD